MEAAGSSKTLSVTATSHHTVAGQKAYSLNHQCHKDIKSQTDIHLLAFNKRRMIIQRLLTKTDINSNSGTQQCYNQTYISTQSTQLNTFSFLIFLQHVLAVNNHNHLQAADLTLRLLMSYIYGAPSKARNSNVVYIWTYVRQR